MSGEVTPDLFIIDKNDFRIVSKKINRQEWQLIKNPSRQNGQLNIKSPVPQELQSSPKITDEEVLQLASIGKLIEEHYGFPQDIEWAKENGKLYITQARPVTTIKENAGVPAPQILQDSCLLTGSPASPGMACGPVKVLKDSE